MPDSIPIPLLSAGPFTLAGAANAAPVLAHDPAYMVADGTLAFDFSADVVDGRRFLLSKDSSGFDDGGHIGVYIENGRLVARLQDTSETYVLQTGVLVGAGETHHLAVNFGTGGLELYLDGAQVGSLAYTGGLVGNAEPIVIGANQWASGDLVADILSDGFDGDISSVALYGSRLTPEQIGLLAAGDPDNNAPVAVDDTYVTNEDDVLSVTVGQGVLANDSDTDSDPLTSTGASGPEHGTVNLATDGSFVYTPDSNYSGSDSFTYRVADGRGGTAIATVNITIDPSNDAPEFSATQLTLVTSAEAGAIIGALGATDPDGDTLSYTIIDGDPDGVFSVDASGNLVLADPQTIDINVTPSYALNIAVSDGTEITTATITVQLSDQSIPIPLLSAGPFTLAGAANAAPVLAHDPAYMVADGTLAFDFSADVVDGRRFLLSKDSSGFDDGGHIGVYIENGRLVARLQDTSETYVLQTGVLVGAGETHHLAVNFGTGGLELYLDGAQVGSLAYTGGLVGNAEPIVIGANQWASGDLVADILSDGFDGDISSVALYGSRLTPEQIGLLAAGDPDNNAPVAVDDTYVTNEDDVLSVTVGQGVLANDSDTDSDPLTSTGASGPEHGTVNLATDGSFVYTPDSNYSGSDSFTYRVADGRGGTAIATVNITIDPSNDAPEFSATQLTLVTSAEAGAIIGALGATDPDGDTLSYTIIDGDPDGVFSVDASGNLVLADPQTIDINVTPSYALNIAVSDGTEITTATITVQLSDQSIPIPLLSAGPFTLAGAANAAPVLAHDPAYMVADGTLAFDFSADVVDGRRFLLSKDSSGFDDGGHIGVYIENGRLVARLQDTSETYVLQTGVLVGAGETHHLAVNFGTGGLELYLDGAQVGSLAYTGGLVGNAEPIVIGANQWASGDLVADILSDGFDGDISSVALYGSRLTPEQIGLLAGSSVAYAPVAGDDGLTTDQDVPLLVDVASDLLSNDSDANGDAISLDNFTQPANGTLVDNGDGTLSYTPNASYNGVDSFTYTVTDGTLTDTANANITVNSDTLPPTSDIVSDDFAGGVLDPIWNIEGPTGTSANLATNATDAFLELVTPDGSHDVWGTNNGARAMQDISDGDFQLETRFLSTPTDRYQLQGFLVEQDADNWIRFDTYSDGTTLRAFAAVTTNGSSSAKLSATIPGGSAPYLQVTRAGDLWTMEYSTDGTAWTAAGSFTQSLIATSAGVFAGNIGQATGFTAQVDYFENTADPIADEDGTFVPVNVAPVAGDDGLTTDQDVPLLVDVASDLLSNDSDANGDAISLDNFTQPANGTLVDNGDGTLSYTPNASYNGVDSFTYTVTDGTLTDTANANITVNSDTPPPTSDIVSDDFAGGVLDPIWNIEGPTGTSANLATNATDAFLELVTPDGSHDVWGTNNGARAMQDISNGDFQLETRFLSTPTEMYQLQGFLVEQDADNWIRFDTYSDGTTLRAFAAVTTNGSSSAKLSATIPGGSAPYLQVTRAGDLWTMEYSTDGTAWIAAGSFTQSLIATSAGVFAGNIGQATGFTAQVDYFENTADPITDEDGTFVPVNVAPVAGDDGLTTDQDVPLLVDVASDLLSNDSDANGDAISLDNFTQPANGTLVDNGDGTLSYTPNASYNGVDSFTYTVTDGTLTDTANANITVNSDTPPPTSDIVSDDFAGGALDPVWTYSGIDGFTRLAATAADGFLEIHSPEDVPVSASDNLTTPRLLQSVTDQDFQISAGFLTEPAQIYQEHGLLVIQDDGNWIRFDLAYTPSGLVLIVGLIEGGSTSYPLFQDIGSGFVSDFRITRSGELWTFEYSADGLNWTEAFSVEHTIAVSQVGVFAGSTSFTGNVPGYTAQVDYFENTADPIADEDGNILPPNNAPNAENDALMTDVDVALVIDVTADLLSNDSDPEGDAISLAAVTPPSNGALTDNGNGTYTYTPNAGFNGVDSFMYTITDGQETATATASITVGEVLPPTSDIVSDDFAGGVLDPIWNIEGPTGTSANLATNATDAFLELVTPDGSHDVWGTNNGARAMQDISDGDFQLETRFLSTPTDRYQLQGFLVEQDADNWIRFDTYSDGTTLRAFAAVTTNGSSSAKLSATIPGGSAPYLQVTRAGDLWTMEYSTDGTAWTAAGSFTQSLIATSAGVFAGNIGQATGFTAQVDYFENTADPIADEDGTFVPVNVAPVAGDDGLTTDQDVPLLVDVASDLLSNDSDANGDAISLDNFTQPANGTLVDNGDGTLSYTPNAGYNGVDSFTYTVSDGTLTDSANVNITVGIPISVWYGLAQTFGSLGEAQEWVNILGNVAGDVTFLSYSLNGGLARNLSVGTDTRRLQNEGDFNIDVSYSELDGSSVDDVITITATGASGNVVTQDVVLHYQDGVIWDANYSIDWSTVTDIQNVAQIVDGTWNVVDGGLRPVDLGYDRVVAIGDQSWDNYELSMTVSTHDLLNIDPNGRDGGGFAIGMLWDGHTDTPIQNFQPKSGWEPGAAFFYTDDNADGIGKFKLHPSEDFFSTLDMKTYTLDEGVTYELLVRVEQTGLYDRTYSMRIWEEGTAEPTEWTLQGTQTFAIEDAPATGSIYLNAHYFDVAFNNLSVTEITGSDIVQGTAGNDQLMAVDTGDLLPGKDEIDVFVGQEGADIFVFGDINGSYYDDGIGATLGETDYGFVWDFTPGADKIQLAGSTNDYLLAEDTANLPAGTSIWLAGTGDDEDELVGLLNAINGIDLGDDYFIFTDTLFA